MADIVIIDYGMGNVHSVFKALDKIADKRSHVKISNSLEEIKKSSHIVFPGQGAASECMLNISRYLDVTEFKKIINKKPFLGICIGMQLLATKSHENGIHDGLGWIDGEIKKIPQKGLKLPHMGWNEVSVKIKDNKILKEENEKNFYFVHSYFFECRYESNEVALTEYGQNFASIISKENIYGVQFHPEKSSNQGLRLIKNFIYL